MTSSEKDRADQLIEDDKENCRQYNGLRQKASDVGMELVKIGRALRNDPECVAFLGDSHPLSAGVTVQRLDASALNPDLIRGLVAKLRDLERERLRLARELHDLGYCETAEREPRIRPRRLGL